MVSVLVVIHFEWWYFFFSLESNPIPGNASFLSSMPPLPLLMFSSISILPLCRPCDMMCCTYRYPGFADPDEVAAAASICLQAYFEGRSITPENLQQCLDYWHAHISEAGDGPKRDVCCEPHCILPCPSDCSFYHKYICHPRRKLPVNDYQVTEELKEVFSKSNALRKKQIDHYQHYQGPIRSSTFCRKCGCRRFCGRHGCCFCTEGCDHFDRKSGDPAPPFDHHDVDDENDASVILRKVLGDPPKNVVCRRWEFENESSNDVVLRTYGKVGVLEDSKEK